MKKTFFIATFLFNKMLWIFGVLIFLLSCNKKQETPKPVFDFDSPGGIVARSFEDGTPNKIDYYQTDEKGNQTKIGEAEFYHDQQERLGGGVKNGNRDGQWYAFFPDGSVQVDAFYIDGIEHGYYTVYRGNGNPYYKGHYDHGICDGTWYWYDENGKVTKKTKADKNTIACEYCKKCMELKSKID